MKRKSAARRDNLAAGAGRAVAVFHREIWRKVRASTDRVPGNAWGARAHGKCNRKQTA